MSISPEPNVREEEEPLLHPRTPSPIESPTAGEQGLLPKDESYGTAQYSLMSSYAMAAWAWRSWEFAVALLLIDLYPDSLLMVSAYGITDNIVRVVLGSRVGVFVSKRRLVTGSTSLYLVQNGCIGASALCALALLAFHPQQPQVYWPLLISMVLIGALSSVGSSGVRIAVEVEAVTALAAGNSAKLSQLNAGFRAIDLSCLLLAPLPVGVVMTWLGPPAATLLLGGYTLLVWIPEVSLIRLAVKQSAALRAHDKLKHALEEAANKPGGESTHNGDGGEVGPSTKTQSIRSKSRSSLSVYLHNPVLLPNLALAVLYCTVLSLGFLMTGYLQWSGLSSAEVSMYRGVGALTGLAATALFPVLRRWIGLVATGTLGILYQFTCLLIGVVPVLLVALGQSGGPGAFQPSPGSAAAQTQTQTQRWPLPTFANGLIALLTMLIHGSGLRYSLCTASLAYHAALVRVLVAGVVASRTGLWTYDLALTQLIQERVPKQDISIVCGVQSSLQASAEMVSFLAGVYLADPHLFYWLMLGSLGVVGMAALLYVQFAISHSGGRTNPSTALQSDATI